jgi:hypothetical protein
VPREEDSTKWLLDSVVGVVTPYVALSTLVYGFSGYLTAAPKLEYFSKTPLAWVVLAAAFSLDVGLWFNTGGWKARRLESRLKRSLELGGA